jgi:hypothetical protein
MREICTSGFRGGPGGYLPGLPDTLRKRSGYNRMVGLRISADPADLPLLACRGNSIAHLFAPPPLALTG